MASTFVVSKLHAAVVVASSLFVTTACANAQQIRAAESKFEGTLLVGGSLKLPDSRHYRFWGASMGLQLGVVNAPRPFVLAVRVGLHSGGRGYPDGVSVNFHTLQLGPEFGYELRDGPWSLRPGIGVGYLAQIGADEYGETLHTAYFSPSLGGFWEPGVLLGIEARPIFGLSGRAQHGLALLAHVGFRQ